MAGRPPRLWLQDAGPRPPCGGRRVIVVRTARQAPSARCRTSRESHQSLYSSRVRILQRVLATLAVGGVIAAGAAACGGDGASGDTSAKGGSGVNVSTDTSKKPTITFDDG